MARTRSPDVTWSESLLRRDNREALLKQRGCILWFTGLSGSGKSTLARAVEAQLVADGHLAYVLDGDNVRHGLCGDLGFSESDRSENIRRVGEVARLFADAGCIALAAFISPLRAHRAMARSLAGDLPFVEIAVATPLEVCMQRDPKGLYAKAQRGELRGLTGVDEPYEAPECPDVQCDGTLFLADNVATIVSFIYDHRLISFDDEAQGSGI